MSVLVASAATCLVVSASVLANDLYAWLRDNRLSFTSVKQAWERVHDASYHRFQQAFDAETWNGVVLPILEAPGFVSFLALGGLLWLAATLSRALRRLKPDRAARALARIKRYSRAELEDMFARAKMKAQDTMPEAGTPRPLSAFERDPHIANMDDLFARAVMKQADMHVAMHQDNAAAAPDAEPGEAPRRRRRFFSRAPAAA